jgi:ubiquinone/menaquinone biosynthesis C-methylase UbiE
MRIPAGAPFSPNYWHNQFDLVAPFYPALERCVFGSRLDEARQAFYDCALQADRILLVGEGNGRFLASLLARKIGGSIRVVEKSPVMIRLAKDRIDGQREADLEFIEADIRHCIPERPFDYIVTHFFLDQFNPPAQQVIIDRFTELSTEEAAWINVDFVPPRTRGGRTLMWLQYAFFRVMTRLEARRCFDESTLAAQSGWIVLESLSFLSGFIVAKRYQKRRR